MKLTALRIQNYKSIDDTGTFTVADSTCLVGKNESGKTAILEALHRLNPVLASDSEYSKREYPRRRWDRFDATEPVITSTWALEETDIAAIETVLGTGSVTSDSAIVEKGYDNALRWTIQLSETAIIEHLKGLGELTAGAAERLSGVTSIAELATVVSQEETKGEAHLHEILTSTIPDQDAAAVAQKILEDQLPVFLYFPEYAVMPGKVAIADLVQREAEGTLKISDEIFNALLALVGKSPEEIATIGHSEDLIAELEGVSNKISDEIFEYWSQNRHLRVNFRFQMGRPEDPPPFNEWVFETRIENTRHRATVNFDERSTGFTWFFSFLVWFSHLSDIYGERLFLLLDEPGLSLHARAQADLLRFFRERLVPAHQLIYTTHSPFMIDPDLLTDARTVEDVVGIEEGREVLHGTKVGDRVLSSEKDTIFPLYAALGYDITQTLFVGKNTLLVEGPSDLLYLKWASHQLQQRTRVGLDPRWVIAPAGGIDKVSSFVTLFGGLDLNIAVLTDFQHGDKAKVRSLRESELLQTGHVLTADSYVAQDEADIEDIMGRENYIELVNAALEWTDSAAMPADSDEEPDQRVLHEVQAHNRTLTAEHAEFDHYKPALYLTEHSSTIELPDLDGALDRFERLFTDLNSLLRDV